MRFISSAVCGAMLAATVTALSVADASAWSRFHDHIYADSFGNLVIQSPNGYKRIVVGQGHLAGKLKSYEGVRDPDVVYLDQNDEGYEGGALYGDCYRPPHIWKGRSYMYGLPDGVIPQAPCADE